MNERREPWSGVGRGCVDCHLLADVTRKGAKSAWSWLLLVHRNSNEGSHSLRSFERSAVAGGIKSLTLSGLMRPERVVWSSFLSLSWS